MLCQERGGATANVTGWLVATVISQLLIGCISVQGAGGSVVCAIYLHFIEFCGFGLTDMTLDDKIGKKTLW